MNPIILTDKALKQLYVIQKENNISTNFLRIGASGGGCSGLQYDLEFDDKFHEDNDNKFYQDNMEIVIDTKSLSVLSGTVLDYSDGLNGKGFEFSNPLARTVCGCNKSFSC